MSVHRVYSVGTPPLPLGTLQTLCSWFSIIERVFRSGRVFPRAQLLLVLFKFHFFFYTFNHLRTRILFFFSPNEISDDNKFVIDEKL